MTTRQIWGFLAPRAVDTTLTEVDAKSAVGIWATCAWTMNLIDDVKASRSSNTDAAKLTFIGRYDTDVTSTIQKVVSESKLGVISTAHQFVSANDCAKGFST